ncbi:MAG: manganese efflux pump [Candidatus Lokiarchaeota archaeon]|nr:manganese efflux pump [Candidatus Lokiarchaeota archaeon]
MDLLVVLIIAIALAMDAFAVSISSGIIIKETKIQHALKIAFFTGFFQAFFTFLGWLGGTYIAHLISEIDHWIAFFLLLIIGSKMIYESRKDSEKDKKINPLEIRVLFLLGIATSIDALAVGLSFAVLNSPILVPTILIGIVAFSFSVIGVLLGNKVGQVFGKRVEILGGLILIGIGLNILINHLFF